MKFKAQGLLFILVGCTLALAAQDTSWIEKGYQARTARDKVDCFTRSIETEGPSLEAYYCRAGARLEAGDFKGALADYTMVIDFDPEDASSWFSRGFARHYYSRDFPGALEDYTQASSLDASNSRYAMMMGLVCAILGDYPNAILNYRRTACDAGPDARQFSYAAGLSVMRSDRRTVGDALAIGEVNTCHFLPSSTSDACLLLAMACYFTGDTENARIYFWKAKETNTLLRGKIDFTIPKESQDCIIYNVPGKSLETMFRDLQ